MTFRAYRSDRRRGRRRWPLIVVTLIAIVSVVVYLVSRQTEQRGGVEFFAAADQASDISISASAELEGALSSIGVIDRQELTRRLQSVADSATEADSLLNMEIPSNIGNSYGTMATATASWARGARDVNTAITAIMDGVLIEGATEQLEAALDLLRVGDSAYDLFMENLPTVDEGIDVSGFVSVTYVNLDAPALLIYDAQSLVIRIQTSYDLSPHHDVSVNGTTTPDPIGETGGIPVVPFAPSIDVQAVVTNVGNQDEPTVIVVMDVIDITSGVLVSQTQTITDLIAGASTTVTFSDVDIRPGSLYQVKITLEIEDDIDLDNNVWDMRFLWRGES